MKLCKLVASGRKLVNFNSIMNRKYMPRVEERERERERNYIAKERAHDSREDSFKHKKEMRMR
jgi:hypothetical protein